MVEGVAVIAVLAAPVRATEGWKVRVSVAIKILNRHLVVRKVLNHLAQLLDAGYVADVGEVDLQGLDELYCKIIKSIFAQDNLKYLVLLTSL